MIKDLKLYKILVVEDNLGDFVLVEEYISEHFFNTKITNVKNFKEFKQIVSASQDFDIIFLDLSLPDKFGIELIKEVKQLVSLIPIVVLTGYSDFNFAIESLSLDVSDYLLKENLNPSTLHKCIIYNIERNKNIIQLKESEKRYLDLFQFSPVPLIVFSLKTDFILTVNDSAMEKYQYSLDEFRKMKIQDIKDHSDFSENPVFSESNFPYVSDALELHKIKNGDPLYVLINKRNFIYNNEESVILSVEDITKEVNFVQSIQLQNKKLRDIGWTQSHVVRAPLARIMGLINLVVNNSEQIDDINEVYSMILDSSKELDRVIRNIVNKTKEV